LAQGLFFFAFQAKPEGRMTQEYDTTTERSSGFQGLGGGAYQQALCNSGLIALLATIIPNGVQTLQPLKISALKEFCRFVKHIGQ